MICEGFQQRFTDEPSSSNSPAAIVGELDDLAFGVFWLCSGL